MQTSLASGAMRVVIVMRQLNTLVFFCGSATGKRIAAPIKGQIAVHTKCHGAGMGALGVREVTH